jgi:hypothetical protein
LGNLGFGRRGPPPLAREIGSTDQNAADFRNFTYDPWETFNMRQKVAAAKSEPSPLPLTKKIKVPLTEREAARIDPRQLDMFAHWSAATATAEAALVGGPSHGDN